MRTPQIVLVCNDCGQLARLREINAYPFTKGLTELVYGCGSCGTDNKLSIQAANEPGHLSAAVAFRKSA